MNPFSDEKQFETKDESTEMNLIHKAIQESDSETIFTKLERIKFKKNSINQFLCWALENYRNTGSSQEIITAILE